MYALRYWQVGRVHIHRFFKKCIQNHSKRGMVELRVVQRTSFKKMHTPPVSELRAREPISDTVRKEIIRLFWETRLSLREIAKRVKTSHATVSRVTEEAGPPRRMRDRLDRFFADEGPEDMKDAA